MMKAQILYVTPHAYFYVKHRTEKAVAHLERKFKQVVDVSSDNTQLSRSIKSLLQSQENDKSVYKILL